MNRRRLYAALSPVLRPFGLPYAMIMKARRELYGRGALPSHTPKCPCVSVGNIAWGGSGKTPVVAWLLEEALQMGQKAAVLSRGYGAHPGRAPLLVKPGTPVERAGDEPLMLARRFPEAGVVVFPARALAARYAEQYLEPDLLILDDGMQHLAVRRHLELTLLRPADLDADWNRVIPSGSWREGASALAAVSAFLIKAGQQEFAELVPLARKRLEAFSRPVFSFSMEASGLRPLFPASGEEYGAAELLPPEEYMNVPYILISGVGNPVGVEKTAAELIGRRPVQHFDFADHHPYSTTDVQALVKMAAAPLPVVCTAKDAVKLGAFAEEFGNVPVRVLETSLKFGPALFTEQDFPAWWREQRAAFSSGGV